MDSVAILKLRQTAQDAEGHYGDPHLGYYVRLTVAHLNSALKFRSQAKINEEIQAALRHAEGIPDAIEVADARRSASAK